MPTYRLDIEYDGADWNGWQIQPDQPSVQGAIETALQTALRQVISIVGSGRTDTGVHAAGQVAHFNLDSDVDTYRLLASLNGILPSSIVISRVSCVTDDFHARYDARLRTYRYRISSLPSPFESRYRWHVKPAPDIRLMNDAARLLLGEHHFGAFCRSASETKNRVCTVVTAEWIEEQRAGDASFVIAADRFLHGMVRAIVGTLVEVGQGRRQAEDLVKILASKDRREAGLAAPAQGLTLEMVSYDEKDAARDHPLVSSISSPVSNS